VECRTQRILKAEIHTVDIKNSTAVRCGVVDDIVLCVEDVTLAVKGEQNRTELNRTRLGRSSGEGKGEIGHFNEGCD
jgi:hypothetical protein